MTAQGAKMPTARKTGTTIVGCVFAEGVVLGADTRATGDTTVVDKNCEKIHKISDNIYCCGAGTAADTQQVTDKIASRLALHRMNTGRESRVCTSLAMLKEMLFRYQGNVSAALVLGGVDINGPHIYTVYPHGSTDHLGYATMGSGSLAAMAIFEARYKDDMTEEEAKELVKDAIESGIFNDLGSGGSCDICVIKKDSTDFIRGFTQPNPRTFKREYEFEKGATPILGEDVEFFEGEAMDL
jgi:20S proteasome subunit beta 2